MLRASLQGSHSRAASTSTQHTLLPKNVRFIHSTSSSAWFHKLGDEPPTAYQKQRNRVTGLSWHENGAKKKVKEAEQKLRELEEARLKKKKHMHERFLNASRLANAKFSKKESDQYSGWTTTEGQKPSKAVPPPPLSKEGLRSKAISAILDESTAAQLGKHTTAILFEPLMLPAMPKKTNLGVTSYPQPTAKDASSEAPIRMADFVFPRADVRPGDFVELRRKQLLIGVVLPVPESEGPASAPRDSRDLYVLMSTGEVAVARHSDIMICIPNLVEPELALAATPATRERILTLGEDAPTLLFQPPDAKTEQSISTAGPSSETPTLDESRFQARASICNKIRILERQKEREMQRLFPAFQSILLLDPAQQKEELQALREAQRHFPQDEEIQLSAALFDRTDLRTGTITTPVATKLLYSTLVRDAVRDSLKLESVAPLTVATIYACHVLLMENPAHFVADSLSHRTSQLFTCRSAEVRRNLELGYEWEASAPGTAEHGYIASFCEKAKRVLAWRNANAYDDRGVPRMETPSISELDVQWNEQDKTIVNFLLESLGQRRLIQGDKYGSVAMSILKQAGAHIEILAHPADKKHLTHDEALSVIFNEEERARPLAQNLLLDVSTDVIAGPDIQHSLVMRFLKDIGVLPEWQNPIRLQSSFRAITLGENDGEPDPVREANVPKQDPTSLARKYSLTLDEEVEKKRVDFGRDATVYVIDSPDAFELDDGISFEPVVIPGQESQEAWVHVHVADPSALVQPDSPLALRANRRFTTLYFPEARWSMLPDDFVRSNAGLRQATSDDSAGQRTLTFSALIDLSTGLVQDTQVRPGLVHDVQTISYDQVSKSVMSPSDAGLPTKHASDLKSLFKLAEKLSENRARAGGVYVYSSSASVHVSPLSLPSAPAQGMTLDRPRFSSGFPRLDLPSFSSSQDDIPKVAEFMVAEMMVMAGRIAGAYGHESHLPLPYRGQPAFDSEADIDRLYELRENMPAETGSVISPSGLVGHSTVPYEVSLKMGLTLPPTSYSSSAAGHFLLGVPATSPESAAIPAATIPSERIDAISSSGYLRVTSPLRRYADLMVHWQLKEHLVRGKSRLSYTDMDALLPQLQRQDNLAKQLSHSATRYWVHALCRYALIHQHDTSLPDEERARLASFLGPLDAFVSITVPRFEKTTLSAKMRVNLHPLNIPASMEWSLGSPPPERGQRYKVEITDVLSSGSRSGLIVRPIETS